MNNVTFTIMFCPLPVNDYPHDKYLNRHVRDKVCAAGPDVWRDLGVELMEQKDVYILDTIQTDSPDNVKRCCTRMFTEWRQRTPKASWKQLIEALRDISLTQLANELEGLLMAHVHVQGVGQESEISLTNTQQRLEKPSQEPEGSYYNVNLHCY